MTHFNRFLVLTSLPAALLVPSVVYAQECVTDSDCPTSFVCEVTGMSTCAGVACPPNEPCPPPPPCETTEYRECVPGPCASDADCSGDMRCFTETQEICTATDVACDPSGYCPPPADPTCTTETFSQCVYPWQLPCTADADCGEGFSCVEQQDCWCSGSSGSSGGGTDTAGTGGAASEPAPAPEPVPPPDCGCSPSGVSACIPQEIPCAADADCPDTWTCESMGSSGTCTASVSPDGGMTEPVCTTEPAVMQCMPPGGRFAYQAAGSGSLGGSDTTGGSENGAPVPAADPSTSTGGAGTGIDPVGDPTGSDVAAQGSSSSGDSGGCSTSRAPASGGAGGALALLAGLFAATRRRRHAAR